jgi:hypothetical protein
LPSNPLASAHFALGHFPEPSAAKLSQAELALRVGIDRAYVSGLELAQRNATLIFQPSIGCKNGALFEEEAFSFEAKNPVQVTAGGTGESRSQCCGGSNNLRPTEEGGKHRDSWYWPFCVLPVFSEPTARRPKLQKVAKSLKSLVGAPGLEPGTR